jgi:Flp pilus assembly protein CpaB
MRAIIITVFGVSLLVAVVALMNMTRRGDAAVPQEQVLASSMDLAAGTLLRAQDIAWRPVNVTEPDQIAHPNATAIQARPEIVDETKASVYGAVLRRPLTAGAPIRRGDIVKPGDRDFLQVVLVPGQRAVAIPVATGGASTGLLQAGDRVDVILTQNFKNDPNQDAKNAPITRRSVSETIAQNLRVLAIDAPDTRPNAANGNFGRTVTLEVSPEQAEQINVATELGKLSVTLRSFNAANIVPPTRATENGGTPSEPTNTKSDIRPQWAGDVSPALYGTAQPKPAAINGKPITVFHGGHVEHVLGEVIQPDSEK